MYSKEFRILDLFCGAGGFSYGLHTVEGFSTEVALEWDPVIINTFKKNMPDTDCVCGDICDEKIKEIVINKAKERKVNMIIGGPPCQSWSEAGALRGINDKRGQLFFDFIRILQDKQPLFFLAENVSGMLLGRHSEALSNIKICLQMLELAMNYHLICLMHMIIMSRKIVKGYFL